MIFQFYSMVFLEKSRVTSELLSIALPKTLRAARFAKATPVDLWRVAESP